MRNYLRPILEVDGASLRLLSWLIVDLIAVDSLVNYITISRIRLDEILRFVVRKQESLTQKYRSLIHMVGIFSQGYWLACIDAILEIRADNTNLIAIQHSFTAPCALMNANERYHEIRLPRPLHAAHGKVDGSALRQHLLQPILAHVSILDGVGRNKRREAVGLEQTVDTAHEVSDQIAQPGRRIFPLHIGAECMAVGAAQRLAPQIRRIAQDAVEATARQNLRELQEPVEEALLDGRPPGRSCGLALRRSPSRQVFPVFAVGNRQVRLRLGQIELGNGDGGNLVEQPGVLALREINVARPLGVDLRRRPFGQGGDFAPAAQHRIHLLLQGWRQVEGHLFLLFAFSLVAFAQQFGHRLVVAGQRGKSCVGHALLQVGPLHKAHNRIATLDVVVKEVERFAGAVRFQPERHFAQFHRQRIEVHAVDAGADHIAHRRAERRRRRLILPRPHAGQRRGNPPRRCQQNVAGAAGDIGDAQGKQGVGSEERVGNEGVEAYFSLCCKEVIREIVIREISVSRARAGAAVGGSRRSTRWQRSRCVSSSLMLP